MSKTILSENQQKFLVLMAKNRVVADSFYLTGGTALCEFYIPYRFSEDLDFFSEREFEVSAILTFLKSVKRKLGFKKIDLNTSFNRNIFQIIFDHDVLKLEYTYFPFLQIEKPKLKKGIKVDSLIDIAVNKLFTIYQNPRSRDFSDLYQILEKSDYDLEDLIIKAKTKFDWHVDLLKLGSQFMKAKELKDYPKLIKKIDHGKWQKFFTKKAQELGKDFLKT